MKKVCLFLLCFTSIFAGCKFNNLLNESDYTVNYYLQNVDDDDYELVDTETKTGNAGDLAEITLNEYEGFTALNYDIPKISNGLVIDIKYDRNIISYTLNYNGGLVKDSEDEAAIIKGRYGASIKLPAPEKKGYLLENWYDSEGNVITEVFEKSATYTASYITVTNADYVVHHFFQNLDDDDYTEDESLLQTYTAKVGTKTEAMAEEVTGFTSKEITQKTIAPEGNTEVSIYYDRNLITFTLNLANGESNKTITKKYGSTVSITNPKKNGTLKFSGWNPVLPETFTEDGTYTAVYGVPSYTVKYLFENLSDNEYSSDSNYPDETYLGTVGTTTDVTAKNIQGFIAQDIEQQTIAEDSSTVVEIKYTRKIITIYIDLKKGVGKCYVQGKYCKKDEVNESHQNLIAALNSIKNSDQVASRTGYTFEKYVYDDKLAFTLDKDESTSIRVSWKGGQTAYYGVRVNLEKLNYRNDDDKYELVETKWLKSVSGESLDYEQKDASEMVTFSDYNSTQFKYAGFKPINNVCQGIEIAGNDTSVVDIYFDRKIIKYTFNAGDGGLFDDNKQTVEISGRYGSSVESFIPVKYGYNYAWKNANNENITPDKFLSEDQTLTANWTPKKYKVNFYKVVKNGNPTEFIESQYVEYGYVIPKLKTTDIENEFNQEIGGWSFDEDWSTLDFEYNNANKNKFILPEDTQTEINLYSLWKVNITVRIYIPSNNNYDIYKTISENLFVTYYKGIELSDKELCDLASLDQSYYYQLRSVPITYSKKNIFCKFQSDHKLPDIIDDKPLTINFKVKDGKMKKYGTIDLDNREQDVSYYVAVENANSQPSYFYNITKNGVIQTRDGRYILNDTWHYLFGVALKDGYYQSTPFWFYQIYTYK